MTFSTLHLHISFLFHIFYTLRYEWMRFMETYEGRRFISFLVKKMEISGNLEDKRCSWLLISGWSSLTASWGDRSPPVSHFGRIFRWCPVIPLSALPWWALMLCREACRKVLHLFHELLIPPVNRFSYTFSILRNRSILWSIEILLKKNMTDELKCLFS